MHNQVTVEKAIHNGKMTVIYPMSLFLVVSPIICLLLLKKYENMGMNSMAFQLKTWELWGMKLEGNLGMKKWGGIYKRMGKVGVF